MGMATIGKIAGTAPDNQSLNGTQRVSAKNALSAPRNHQPQARPTATLAVSVLLNQNGSGWKLSPPQATGETNRGGVRLLHETLSPFTIARIEIVDTEIPEHETNESFGQKVRAEIDKLIAYEDSPITLPDFYGIPKGRAIVITAQGPSLLIERWDFVYRVLYASEEWIVPERGEKKNRSR